jgi:hypothetical protein
VLELSGWFGRPPNLSEIGKEIGFAPEQIQALVSELQAHDLLGVDDPAGAIDYACRSACVVRTFSKPGQKIARLAFSASERRAASSAFSEIRFCNDRLVAGRRH